MYFGGGCLCLCLIVAALVGTFFCGVSGCIHPPPTNRLLRAFFVLLSERFLWVAIEIDGVSR